MPKAGPVGTGAADTGLRSGRALPCFWLSAKQHLKASSLIFNTNGRELRLQTPAGEELGLSPEPTEVNVIMEMTEV